MSPGSPKEPMNTAEHIFHHRMNPSFWPKIQASLFLEHYKLYSLQRRWSCKTMKNGSLQMYGGIPLQDGYTTLAEMYTVLKRRHLQNPSYTAQIVSLNTRLRTFYKNWRLFYSQEKWSRSYCTIKNPVITQKFWRNAIYSNLKNIWVIYTCKMVRYSMYVSGTRQLSYQ